MVTRDRNKTDNRNEKDTETMKYLRFKLLVLLCVLAHSLGSFAYDVVIDGIYYNLNKSNFTAEVTKGDYLYSGVVNIPEHIVNDNKNLYNKCYWQASFPQLC